MRSSKDIRRMQGALPRLRPARNCPGKFVHRAQQSQSFADSLWITADSRVLKQARDGLRSEAVCLLRKVGFTIIRFAGVVQQTAIRFKARNETAGGCSRLRYVFPNVAVE